MIQSIEELSDIILRLTGANPELVSYRESEVLTTKIKQVDVSKAIQDLAMNAADHSYLKQRADI